MIQKLKNKSIKWWIGRSSCIVLFLFIAIFSYAKANFILKGIRIEVNLEKDNNSSLVQINGNAKNAIHLILNGREIFIDKNGNFSETVGLLPGFSVITLNAEDKFGKSTEKKFDLVYNENTESVAMLNTIIN